MSDDEVLAILSNLDTRKLSTRFISQNQDLNTPTARILLNIILIAVVSAFLKHTYSLDRLVQQVGNAIFNLGILQPTLHIELNAKFFKFRSFVFIVSAGHASASHELFYPQIGVGKRLDGGRRRVKKYLWSFFKNRPGGAGQAVTCSTSGMGLRLK